MSLEPRLACSLRWGSTWDCPTTAQQPWAVRGWCARPAQGCTAIAWVPQGGKGVTGGQSCLVRALQPLLLALAACATGLPVLSLLTDVQSRLTGDYFSWEAPRPSWAQKVNAGVPEQKSSVVTTTCSTSECSHRSGSLCPSSPASGATDPSLCRAQLKLALRSARARQHLPCMGNVFTLVQAVAAGAQILHEARSLIAATLCLAAPPEPCCCFD